MLVNNTIEKGSSVMQYLPKNRDVNIIIIPIKNTHNTNK